MFVGNINLPLSLRFEYLATSARTGSTYRTNAFRCIGRIFLNLGGLFWLAHRTIVSKTDGVFPGILKFLYASGEVFSVQHLPVLPDSRNAKAEMDTQNVIIIIAFSEQLLQLFDLLFPDFLGRLEAVFCSHDLNYTYFNIFVKSFFQIFC